MARLALVLGGGGARGYAHIGVLQVARERGHEVATIAGSSMGALVGGLDAAGKLGDFTVWALGLKQFDVLRLMDPAIRDPGVIKAQRVTRHISDMLGGVHIEDLPIPYTAVATDLGTRREVWFQAGPLDVAIRASIALPSLITPVVVNNRLLVDGGVVNPMPIEPTLAVPVDATVAVDLAGPNISQGSTEVATTPLHETSDQTTSPEWLARFRRGAAELIQPLARRTPATTAEPPLPSEAPTVGALPKDLGMVELISQTVDLMGAMITRYRSASNPPDVLIRVPHDACRVTDFHRAEEMITMGRRLAIEAFDAVGL